jgi:hypothetical protein
MTICLIYIDYTPSVNVTWNDFSRTFIMLSRLGSTICIGDSPICT